MIRAPNKVRHIAKGHYTDAAQCPLLGKTVALRAKPSIVGKRLIVQKRVQ
jgi:hypothetical protein